MSVDGCSFASEELAEGVQAGINVPYSEPHMSVLVRVKSYRAIDV